MYGFTLVELLVVVAIISAVIFALNKIFGAIYIAYQESEERLRIQRDLKNITYWFKQDFTGFVQTQRNFDILSNATQFVFICADDPKDTDDWENHPEDDDFDTFVYRLQNRRIFREVDKYNNSDYEITRIFNLDSIETGDTFSWNFSIHNVDGNTFVASDYDNTLFNFEKDVPIDRIAITLSIRKKKRGFFRRNMPDIYEETRITAITNYKRGR
ncbi:MAG: type II secretion system protein [Candidatus Hydrogenedentota bacterium]